MAVFGPNFFWFCIAILVVLSVFAKAMDDDDAENENEVEVEDEDDAHEAAPSAPLRPSDSITVRATRIIERIDFDFWDESERDAAILSVARSLEEYHALDSAAVQFPSGVSSSVSLEK